METSRGSGPGTETAPSSAAETLDLISILCPTRDRPSNVARLVVSALETARCPERVEVVLYQDDDDPTILPRLPNTRVVAGPRVVLSQAWNLCYAHADGELLMHAGDDLIFRTTDWDARVRRAFARVPDRIAFVHGDDGSGQYGNRFGTHGFLHRRWVETIGYFTPPYFSSDWADTWLNDVANLIGRRVYLADVITEHMHPAWGKAEWDRTHQERLARHAADDVDALYRSLAHERERDASLLAAEIRRRAA